LVTIDGIALRDLHHPPFSSSHNVIIYFPEIGKKTDGVISLLEKVYPAQQVVAVLFDQKTNPLEWEWVSLESLKESSESVAALFIPPLSLDSTLESFQEVIAHLRAEDGCPWDKKQTHSSLRPYLLEETYEALDSLDKGDLTGLKEELGDLLLQIALHAQIAEEAQEFTMADVLTGINRKIVYRHPHVFKDWVVDGEKEVVQNWESLKGQERLKNGTEETKGMLEGVPVSFPALAQAQAIQERAARVGFDWPEITPVLDKVMEELEEVRTAANDVERAKELGDLLFALVNLVRWYKMDAESALRQTNLKFRKRFAYIEEKARITENSLQKMTLAEMDKFWEESKAFDD
jgi:tetrapyrrole methylase family protein/MazG family protein